MTEQAPISDPILYGKPLRFMPKAHRYTWDGQSIPSVTGILGNLAKPALIDWAANCAVDHIESEATHWLDRHGAVDPLALSVVFDEARKAHTAIRDKAGDVGTVVHEFAREMMLLPDDIPIVPSDETAARCCGALLSWAGKHHIVPAANGCERRVMSLQHWYCGTCDFFGNIDGTLSVLDFKTGGRRVYDEAWYQTAGYEVAIREELGLSADKIIRHVVHIDKETGKVTHEQRMTSAAHTSAWLHLVGFHAHAKAARKEAA